MPAILRTHGGLGNQLFQVLYGRLFSEKFGLTLREVHDTSYKHAFPRSLVLRRPATSPAAHERLLSAMRLPKVIQRLTRKQERALWLFGSAYLDGYFQEASSYAIFDIDRLKQHLRAMSAELGIVPVHNDRCLVHLRVGDFFKTRSEARDHVMLRLSSIPPGADVMTNDEALLAEPAIAAMLVAKNCQIVSTTGFAAEDVLRLMSTYAQLDANDSTLVFWASVLGECQTSLRNASLRATQNLFARSLKQPV